MIQNDKEYEITKGWALKFEQSLESIPAETTDPIQLLHRAAFKSQLDDLREQIAEYEAHPPRPPD